VIAVVVVNFNSAETISRGIAVDGLERCSTVIVVDNASSESDRMRLISLAEGRGWTVVVSPTNRGFGAGCNLGASKALALGATEIVFLNPDARIDPENLKRLASRCAENAVVISPRIELPSGKAWFEGGLIDRRIGHARHLRRSEVGSIAVEWLSGACLCVSADVFTEVGGFSESYFLYWEDVDFCTRARLIGTRTEVDHSIVAVHEVGGTQLETGKSLVYYSMNVRNRAVFARRFYSVFTRIRWLMLTPAYILMLGRAGGVTHSVRSLGRWILGSAIGVWLSVWQIDRSKSLGGVQRGR